MHSLCFSEGSPLWPKTLKAIDGEGTEGGDTDGAPAMGHLVPGDGGWTASEMLGEWQRAPAGCVCIFVAVVPSSHKLSGFKQH